MFRPRTKTELRLSWWPSLQDYNEAVQITATCLHDPELKQGLVYSDAMGLPRPITGSFASVYRMQCSEKDFALRLFLRNIPDQQRRYALISDFVQHDDLPYTVTFDYLENGIKLRGDWLPALKMEWVDGISLDDYIVEHLADAEKLEQLLSKFVRMMKELHDAGIAHGDLQHGNIILCGDELRLVDYDGMFVPKMIGYPANELGHRNYQHPKRAEKHFGPYLDNFSAWIIYASVRALQIDPRLMHQLGAGDDCLLFRQTDFVDPLNSATFSALEKHDNSELQLLGRFVRAQLDKDLPDIPYLRLPLPDLGNVALKPVSEDTDRVRSGPRLMRGKLPDWLEDKNADTILTSNVDGTKIITTLPDSSNKVSQVNQSWIVSAKVAPVSWIKPSVTNQTTVNSVFHGTTTPPAANISVLPPELAGSNRPRKVTYNQKSGRISPTAWQWMMLLNPAVWLMIVFFSTVFGVDMDLARHGVDYPATITDVDHHTDKYGAPEATITVDYKVDGANHYQAATTVADNIKKYQKGKSLSLRVLPTKPYIHENLEEAAGSKQYSDLLTSLLFMIITLFGECWIWFPAVFHKHLAKNGLPVEATVFQLWIETGSKGESYHKVTLTYKVKKRMSKTMTISQNEWYGLRTGGTEIILCDPRFHSWCVIYKYCRYHPVLARNTRRP